MTVCDAVSCADSNSVLKDSLLHLPVFLLNFVLVATTVTGAVLLGSWAGLYNPSIPYESGWLIRNLPGASSSSLTVSVLISLYLLFGRIQRRPGRRLLSFVLPLVLCFALIAGGTAILSGPRQPANHPEGSIIYPFVPATIHSIESGLVYVGAVIPPDGPADGIRLERVVRYSEDGLLYDRTAAATGRSAGDETKALLIPSATSAPAVAIEPKNPVYSPIFEAPDVLQGMIGDVELLNRYLLDTRARSPEQFVLATFSISLLVVSCISFLKLTRWPLFNALFALFLIRGVFLIMRFLRSDIGIEMSTLIANGQINSQMPSFVYLVLGALLVAFNLLFTRRSDA